MTPWGADDGYEAQALLGRTILQVVPALDGSPASVASVAVAAALAEAGARALVAGAPGPLVSELQARGGVFLAFGAAGKKPHGFVNPLTAALNRLRLERLTAREGAELIHVRSRLVANAGFYAARQARIPLVANYDGERPGVHTIYGRGGDLLAQSDCIIAANQAAAQHAVKLHPELASRVHIGQRGIDLHDFAADLVDVARVHRLRAAWGVKAHERLVVIAPCLPEQWDGVLAAAALLLAKGSLDNEAQEVRFVLLERDAQPEAGGFEAAAERLGLSGRVLRRACAERADRAAAFLAAAAVIVAPSGEPGFIADAAVEAQALGVPVVLVEGEALGAGLLLAPPEVDADSRTGWHVRPGQPQALARALEEALRLGAAARETLSQNARAHARTFSVERMCAQTLAIYARRLCGPN